MPGAARLGCFKLFEGPLYGLHVLSKQSQGCEHPVPPSTVPLTGPAAPKHASGPILFPQTIPSQHSSDLAGYVLKWRKEISFFVCLSIWLASETRRGGWEEFENLSSCVLFMIENQKVTLFGTTQASVQSNRSGRWPPPLLHFCLALNRSLWSCR